MDPYIGKLLDNRYEILEAIGSGGMARVYKARCHRLNRLVAIKILREDLAQDAEFRRRFHDESQAVAMLSHPNIVAVYDVSRSSELEYIVMELIDGITLKQYMQKKGNKLNWREALHFITQITKALGHAHSRGIIHRDIKPHNIMVLRDGSVKVADFGIARVASGGHSTLTQEALGSVHYISPEQARGSHIDARSDLYSAGVVLYEMITGRLPFEGDTPVSVAIQHINSIPLSPREIDPSIPEALEAITMKAMAPVPDNRYASADEMLADLEEFRKNPDINFDYDLTPFSVKEEELDQDRTQILSAGRAGQRPPQGGAHFQREDRYEDAEEDGPRRGPLWPILLAAAAVLLFVGLVVALLWNTVFAGLLKVPVTYQVPELVGRNIEQVRGNQELLGRFTLVEGETVTDDADPGTIIRQTPEEGDMVGEDVSQITVTISGGPEIIMMIDLYDMDYQSAFHTLTEMGLKPVLPEYVNSDEVEEGHIISFTPMKDMPLSPGTEVRMVVSRGPEVKEFEMPKLLDMTLETAESTIRTWNLTIGRVDEEVYSDTVPAGHVVSQFPTAGTFVEEGDEVNLQISKGPDPSTIVPDPPPVAEPVEVTKIVEIELPRTVRGRVNVKILMDATEIFNEEVDASEDRTIQLPVTGTGIKTLYVYVDGENIDSTTVELTGAEEGNSDG